MDNYKSNRGKKPPFGNPSSFKKPFKRPENRFEKKESSFGGERRPARSFGDKPAFERREGSFGDRSPRSFGEGRSFEERAPRRERSFGDKPHFEKREGSFGDRPQRSFNDKPRFERKEGSFGDRSPRSFGEGRSFEERAPRRERSFDDKPRFEKREGSFEDRPQRSFNDKPRFEKREGSFGDRPPRSFGEGRSFEERAPRRERSFDDKPRFEKREGSFGDRPQRSFNDKPRFERKEGSFGDRPPRSFGEGRSFEERAPRRERSFDDKPRFERRERSFGERPQRTFGSKPRFERSHDRPAEKGEGRVLELPPELFISCQPSLEELLFEELGELGLNVTKVGFAGVSVENSLENIYKINYCSRLAGKVLVPIAAFSFSHPAVFSEQANGIDWSTWLTLEKTFVIKVNGQSSLFNNTLYAAQLLKDAICDQFREKTGERPSVSLKEADVVLHLFLEENKAVVYFDTSNEPLFKRGWRREAVPAPLQETMAAAVLRLAGYKGEGFFCDPCCGGGTILIEAAMIATKTPPGFYRTSWGFQGLPEHDETLWQKVKQEADNQRVPLRKDSIIGIDIHRDSIRISKVNLISAGFQEEIILTHSDFHEASLPERFDLLVANPPHGERLGDEEQWVPLYRALGDFIKHKGKQDAKAFVYTSSLALSKEIGLKADKRHVITSSGQECRVIEISVNHSSQET